MAKLPDLRVERGSPALPSPKMAGLRGEVQSAYAWGSEISKGLKVAAGVHEKAIDEEARLNARTLANETQREYQSRMADLSQEYHADTAKDPADFLRDVQQLQRTLTTEGVARTSGRAGKYLRQTLDSGWTSAHASALKMQKDLLTSRTLLSLNVQREVSLGAVSADYTQLAAQITEMTESIEMSSLPAADKQEAIAKTTSEFIAAGVNGAVEEGDLAALTTVVDSEAFNKLPTSAQRSVQTAIDNAVDDILSDEQRAALSDLENNYAEPEAEVAMFASRVGDTAMGEAANRKLVEDFTVEAYTAKVYGLMAAGEFEQALAKVRDPEYAKNLKNVAQLRSQIASAQGTNRAAHAGVMKAAITDAIARSTDLRTPVDAAVFAPMTDAANAGELSPSDMSFLELAIEDAETVNAVNSYFAPVIDKPTLAGLYEAQNSTIPPDTENYSTAKSAFTSNKNTASKMITKITESPAAASVAYNPQVGEQWGRFTENVNLALTGDEQAMEQARADYAIWQEMSKTAQLEMGVADDLVSAFPETGPWMGELTRKLTDMDPQNMAQAMGVLRTIVGGGNLLAVADSLSGSDPVAAGQAIYAASPTTHALAMTYNEGIRKGVNATLTPTTAAKYASDSGIDLPFAAAGAYGETAKSMWFTMLNGFASNAEIQSGEYTIENIERARDEVLGQPFTINGIGDSGVSYRGADGLMVPAEHITRQFAAVQIDPSVIANGDDAFYQTGSGLVRADLRQILGLATPVLVGPGQYALEIKGASGYGTAGKLLDGKGNTFVIDIRDVPMADLLRVHELQGGLRASGALGGGKYERPYAQR